MQCILSIKLLLAVVMIAGNVNGELTLLNSQRVCPTNTLKNIFIVSAIERSSLIVLITSSKLLESKGFLAPFKLITRKIWKIYCTLRRY